ncbi:MAG: glycosyltransferase [Candidatus Aenigmatarchaeota archaeon]
MWISLFVPAYNEEQIIAANIRRIHESLSKSFSAFELVIVDDSSTDSTNAIAQELEKTLPHVRVMRYGNGPSRRENLGKAMRTARFNIVAYMDLDLAVPLMFLPRLVSAVERGADIAIGSRYLPGSEFERGPYRLLISKLYHTGLHILFGSQITDYQCGLKVFRRDVLRKLLDSAGYDSGFIRGWFWDAEMLLRAQRSGYEIAEIPVVWKRGTKSSFRLRRELRMLPYIVGLRGRLGKCAGR